MTDGLLFLYVIHIDLADDQEIPASDAGAISLVTSEACTPSQVASKLPPKSPAYTFYSYPTPPPAATPSQKPTTSIPRNTFQATQGGARPVTAATQTTEPEENEGEAEAEAKEADSAEPDVKDLKIEEPAPAPASKGRVLFIYTCPSGSPIKYRMVYSSGVRGMQQDAADKAEIQIAAKVR